jgi:hypothetical protein
MNRSRQTTLALALRSALKNKLEDAWLYLKDNSTPTADSICLIVSYTESELSNAQVATNEGFPQEGLDTQALEDVSLCAAQFQNPPSDELLVESFIYYWRFDAWLPEPGAPEPLTGNAAIQYGFRKFYDLLGPERTNVACKKPGCNRGAISLSIYCRPHHFEMIQHIQCPFDD